MRRKVVIFIRRIKGVREWHLCKLIFLLNPSSPRPAKLHAVISDQISVFYQKCITAGKFHFFFFFLTLPLYPFPDTPLSCTNILNTRLEGGRKGDRVSALYLVSTSRWILFLLHFVWECSPIQNVIISVIIKSL